MGGEHGPVEKLEEVAGNIGELGGANDVAGSDPMDVGGADVASGIHERCPLVDHRPVLAHAHRGNLDDAVAEAGAEPGRLDIDDAEVVTGAAAGGAPSGAGLVDVDVIHRGLVQVIPQLVPAGLF